MRTGKTRVQVFGKELFWQKEQQIQRTHDKSECGMPVEERGGVMGGGVKEVLECSLPEAGSAML